METHEGVLLGPDDKPELIGVTVEITHQTITAWHGPDVLHTQPLKSAWITGVAGRRHWSIGNGRTVVW